VTDDAHYPAPKGTRAKVSKTVYKTFHSLRNRNYRLYFSGQLISNTGNWLTNVALTLLVLKITDSGLAVGLLAAFQYGPILLFTAWAGAIVDRADKRHLLLVTQTLEMAQSAGLAVMAFMPHPSLVGLYALAAAGGLFLAFDNPLRRSFITEMVPAEDIPNAVVLNSVMFNIARIAGPALAGILILTVGYGWCFAIDAATYLAVLYGLYIMRPSELRRHAYRPRIKGEVREGLLYIASMPSLWISFTMVAAIQLFSYNFSTTLPLFVTKALHSSAGTFTLLYSTFSLGAVVSGLIVAQRGLVQLRYIIIGAFAMGTAMLILSSVPSVATAVPAVFLTGASAIIFLTATTAIIQVEGKHEMHGRVLALQTVLTGAGSVLGGPLLGWLADTRGGRAPLVLGGAVCVAAAIFGYFANRRCNQPRFTHDTPETAHGEQTFRI
jgi:MFS family permease